MTLITVQVLQKAEKHFQQGRGYNATVLDGVNENNVVHLTLTGEWPDTIAVSLFFLSLSLLLI